jgi:hypothetical protein
MLWMSSEHAVSQAHDVDFVLADPDGFNEDLLLARGIQQQGNFRGGARESAEKATRSHRTNEYAGIAGVALHADAVA